MIKLIETPNLPNGKTKHCLIGKKYTDEIKELTELGIECIKVNENPLLTEEINSHADILCFNYGNGQVEASNGAVGEDKLKKLGISCLLYDSVISLPYPYDIPLNVAYIESSIICNTKHTSKSIIDFANQKKLTVIDTKQGYARCNLCIVDKKAVITEDDGLASLLKKYQFDVLQIASGDVYLSKEHYGFLGGASCKLSKEEIYFSGNIEHHRDYEEIIKFLNKYHIKPIYNKNRNLRDFGGVIQLTEEI